jgi:XTP/dITP diphosphohydrolase
MKIKRLVLGTENPAKLQEWSKLLKNTVPTIGISQLGKLPEPDESGETFEKNAREKAIHYAKITGEYVFSDDGGYEVEALDGAPGPRSRRILPGGEEGTDDELINYVLEKLEDIPTNKRGVSLTSAVALSDPRGNIIFEDKASLKGVVAKKIGPILIPGYPFRSIHYIPAVAKTFAEFTKEEHEKYNHKKKIAERLTKFLLEYK